MKSAIRAILGFSMMAAAIGCDGGGEEEPTGPIAVAGSSTGGSGGSTAMPGGGSSGSGGGGALPEGVALPAVDGWVPMDSNVLGVQGAMFAYADNTSKVGMEEDFTGTNACIKGTAAKVDMTSMPCATMMFTPPATDCYGEYWGAAIGLNLNQPTVEMDGMMVGGDPVAFDASALKGFAFNIDGPMLPTSLRFKVEGASGEFCTPPTKLLMAGANTFMFEDLVSECWEPMAATMNPNASTIKSGIIKIAWQVVTNDKATIPFDYCVSDVRALQ